MHTLRPENAEARLQPRPWGRLTERIRSTKQAPEEVRRALPVVAGVVLAALLVTLLVLDQGQVTTSTASVAVVLVIVGFAAELLAYYEKSAHAAGSIAQIPYMAAVILLPDYRTFAGIVLAQSAAQLWHRRALVKALFNVGQHALAFSCGLLVFSRLIPTGVAIESSFVVFASGIAIAAAAMQFVMTAINSVAIAAVIGAISQRWLLVPKPAAIWRSAVASVVSVLLAIYLAWLGGHLGPLGAIGMILPLLAVRQLTRTTVELTKVTEELLDLMVAAIEARDPYTSGHSRRVSRASKIIATAMGLKTEQIERVEVAALLHDVGKIDEKFARILAKEGRLTPDEWETMKLHPVRSAQLVGMLSSLTDIVPAVRHHHENWDGTGYPDGISGGQIPLGSRIIMFADTLDAITTDRPYRKALDPEEARREFVKFRGKQFDPMVCDVVISAGVWKSLYDVVRAAHAESAAGDASAAGKAVA